ncbi:hypothetical protein OAP63_04560 [Vibrio sp.]|nr:hypothetical protein [Vibrio sp.]
MNKLLAVGIASALTLSMSSPLFAADSASSANGSVVTSPSQIEQQVAQLLNSSKPVDAMTSFALADPTNVAEGMKAIYLSVPDTDLAALVTAAFQAAPNRALPIANMALELGLDPALLPELALASNIDPTIIAQASAAGGDATGTLNINRRNRGSGISPS